MTDNPLPLPDHWIPLGFIGTNASFQRTAREYAEDYARAAIKASRAAVPAECDVTSILLDVQPGFDGMGVEVYAKTVRDVEDRLTEMGQELEEWQLGIRRHPTAAAPQPVAQPGKRWHVGDSAFEGWFASYSPAGKGDKQRARDAYAAGMGERAPVFSQIDAAAKVLAERMDYPWSQMPQQGRDKMREIAQAVTEATTESQHHQSQRTEHDKQRIDGARQRLRT